MIDINDFYNDNDFKKVCMIFKESDPDDLMRVIFSLGIVASRNLLFKLKNGLKD